MQLDTLLARHHLETIRPAVLENLSASVAFWLRPQGQDLPIGSSKLGGHADVPAGFDWPEDRGRKLDFLLQVRLSDIALVDPSRALPDSGVLSFFYDLDRQPWGYDPADLQGFRVIWSPADHLRRVTAPNLEYCLPEHGLDFGPAQTLPHMGSRVFDRMDAEIDEVVDWEAYCALQDEFERSFYPTGSGLHRMFGHSANVQGDMQLEAQLVTNGMYCGDPSGYNEARAKLLEPGAADWMLLLQLDTDDGADLMWGDAGMLYYWIRREDLEQSRFDRVWMTLQCG